jgi:hypothetical protein
MLLDGARDSIGGVLDLLSTMWSTASKVLPGISYVLDKARAAKAELLKIHLSQLEPDELEAVLAGWEQQSTKLSEMFEQFEPQISELDEMLPASPGWGTALPSGVEKRLWKDEPVDGRAVDNDDGTMRIETVKPREDNPDREPSKGEKMLDHVQRAAGQLAKYLGPAGFIFSTGTKLLTTSQKVALLKKELQALKEQQFQPEGAPGLGPAPPLLSCESRRMMPGDEPGPDRSRHRRGVRLRRRTGGARGGGRSPDRGHRRALLLQRARRRAGLPRCARSSTNRCAATARPRAPPRFVRASSCRSGATPTPTRSAAGSI